MGSIYDFTMPAAESTETPGIKRKAAIREYLYVHETAPMTLLCAYGEGHWNRVGDDAFWKQISMATKTGAAWGTEYASKSASHRGVAANRWLQVQVAYCKYQKLPTTIAQNEIILSKTFRQALYAEIEVILVSMEFLLAPKKEPKKEGTAFLRAASHDDDGAAAFKDPITLDAHAKKIWEWLDQPCSRVRMLMTWQTAGGLPYTAAVHFRLTKSFKQFGNSAHTPDTPSVSLIEFQDCIKLRHELVSDGNTTANDNSDFV
jgi:hypothetical protein